MRIKIFTPNKNGKIELTKEELENLLNESYRQGWNDRPYNSGFYYSYPTATLTADSTASAQAYSIKNSSNSITNICTEALEKYENL